MSIASLIGPQAPSEPYNHINNAVISAAVTALIGRTVIVLTGASIHRNPLWLTSATLIFLGCFVLRRQVGRRHFDKLTRMQKERFQFYKPDLIKAYLTGAIVTGVYAICVMPKIKLLNAIAITLLMMSVGAHAFAFISSKNAVAIKNSVLSLNAT